MMSRVGTIGHKLDPEDFGHETGFSTRSSNTISQSRRGPGTWEHDWMVDDKCAVTQGEFYRREAALGR